MPFTVLFAAMATFWRLTRSHELVVARAAGVSVWQFLLPVLGSSVVIAGLAVSGLNPLAAALLGRYERLEASYVHNQPSMLAVSETGLWLRQAEDRKSVVSGTSVSARVDRGGRRIIKKKKTETPIYIGK